ncbi:MAG: aminotransferase class I/II-fold pyridoxal phosphate-dependent enzyme [Ruminococcus sp.]|nr:aminotransferase class I/II-fold pyridoxal phosphate-dependent enzyme [Ruminococcus sp.]
MEQFLNNALYDVKRSAIRVYSQMAKETPDCIALTLGEPDFDTPQNVSLAAKQSLDSGDTHYIANNGSLELRQAIAQFEKEKNGMDYTADEIIVTIGATEGLFTALFGILNPDDEVVVPEPAFGLYESIVTLCRGKYVPINTGENEFQLTKQMLDCAITEKTKAIILNSPNNPTGCILSRESLENVYNAVKGKNIFVICDDVYRQLIYTDDCPAFCSFRDLRKQLIVIQSFSKPYAMTGWRIGYLMADLSVKQHIEKVHQYTVVSSASFSQKACIEALKTDVSPMIETYRKRRDFVLKRLDEIGLETVTPMGGFYVFPSIEKFGMTSGEFCTRMIKEAGLAATPGACFGSDKHIRLTYCYSDEQLAEGLNRLETFINSLKN